MERKLEGILNRLDKLNSGMNFVTKEELDEQYENLEDYRNLTKDLDGLLNNFRSIKEHDGDEVEKMLLELHRILTTFEWH